MRNETLKNLLLTASLISVSALLTACGETAKDPVKSVKKDNKPTIGSPTGSNDEASKKIETADAALKLAEVEAQQQAQKDAEKAKQDVVKELEKNEDNFLSFINVFNEEQLAAYKKAEATADLRAAIDAYFAKGAEISSFLETTFNTLSTKPNFTFTVNRPATMAEISSTVAAIDKFQAELTPYTKKDLQDFGAALRTKLAYLEVLGDTSLDLILKNMVAEMTPRAGADAELKRTLDAQKRKIGFDRMSVERSLQIAINSIKQRWELRERELTRLQTWKEDLKRDQDFADQFLKMENFSFAIQNSLLAIKMVASGKKYPDIFNVLSSFNEKFLTFLNSKRSALTAASITRDEFIKDFIDVMGDKITVSASDTTVTLAALKISQPINFDKCRSALLKGLAASLEEYAPIFFKDLIEAGDSVTFSLLPKANLAAALSSGAITDLSSNVSLRQARTATTGLVDARAFNMNGVSGQSFELGMPLFVQLNGDVSSAKSTDAATGSVAYRLGNTVIGAIQGYANSGAGFGLDSRQLETSVVASHSFGSFFIEGQIGSVSATEVHNSNWSGLRSQVTLGLDTEFVSPFVQVSHRQLDRSGALDLNETTAYVGLDAEVAKLAADTYSVDTRLLAKAGYGSKNWSATSKELGLTAGFSGSVEWSSSLNLNSGVSFSSNLALDTLAGSSAALNVSLDR
ncbi:MAG: hypothetical protein Q8R43_00775 [Alphaproteobacteria bacterium]|nr:hypothetical protein [Alphaproteobacteria bacterium]